MVEALFFKTYQAYLTGNLPDSTMFFELLVREFKEKQNPNALSSKQLFVLKKIRSAIDTGKIEDFQWVNESSLSLTEDKQAPDIKQKELVYKIHFEGLEKIRELLGAPDIDIYSIEHPCGVHGAVDMVYQNNETCFPTEIKRHEGKHDLVGQIRKYALYFKLRLNLKLYSDVQPVTICNSYNPHTLVELKRMLVIPLKYDIIDDKIKISRV